MQGEATKGGCERLHRALCECHKRVASGPARESVCRHLNRALAECLVADACPEESEAVRSFCSSGGTAHKRSQCQQAQLALSVCLSSRSSWSITLLPSTFFFKKIFCCLVFIGHQKQNHLGQFRSWVTRSLFLTTYTLTCIKLLLFVFCIVYR